MFFASIVTFLVSLSYTCISPLFRFLSQISSALCGAAQSVTWLIVGRAFQGLGGLGVNQLAIVIISDIVPLKEYVLPGTFTLKLICRSDEVPTVVVSVLLLA